MSATQETLPSRPTEHASSTLYSYFPTSGEDVGPRAAWGTAMQLQPRSTLLVLSQIHLIQDFHPSEPVVRIPLTPTSALRGPTRRPFSLNPAMLVKRNRGSN